jgi:hypothetical protein
VYVQHISLCSLLSIDRSHFIFGEWLEKLDSEWSVTHHEKIGAPGRVWRLLVSL